MKDLNVRVSGLLKLSVGAAGFALVLWLILRFGVDPEFGGVRNRGGLAIAAALPGAYALAGMIEILTGVPFTRLSGYWDAMKVWQKATIGILTTIMAVAVAFGLFIALAYWRII